MSIEELIKAAKRHDRRMQAFIAAGLPPDKAYDLADEMLDRDLDICDDRRVCFECGHFQNLLCNVTRTSSPFKLHECPSFVLPEKNRVQIKI